MFLFLFFIRFTSIQSQNYETGQAYQGSNNYITYVAGNLPVVLSSSHGGYLRPINIPDRNCSGCTNVSDFNTLELTIAIADAIYKNTGCNAHVVLNNLHRSKLDANRDLPEAANGNLDATEAWYDFHRFTEVAKSIVNQQFNKGLYLDIHGHGHSIQRLELGYLLYSDELRESDAILNTSEYVGFSSIRNLVKNNLEQNTHSQLLRGEYGLGSLLGMKNYPSVPSVEIPFPLPAEPYFSGGYNTARHGSYRDGSIDGVQVECNQSVRINTVEINKFAGEFATALIEFLNKHYFEDFTDYSCLTSTQNLPLSISEDYVYPNPVQNLLNVNLKKYPKDLTLEIRDAYGKLYLITDQIIINTDNLASGLYFIYFGKQENIKPIRFIKM